MVWRHRILFSGQGCYSSLGAAPHNSIYEASQRPTFHRVVNPLVGVHPMRSPERSLHQCGAGTRLYFGTYFIALFFFLQRFGKKILQTVQPAWGRLARVGNVDGVEGQARGVESPPTRPQCQRRERLSAIFAFVPRGSANPTRIVRIVRTAACPWYHPTSVEWPA